MTEEHPTDHNRNADGTYTQENTAGGHTQKGRATRSCRIQQLDSRYDTLEKLMGLFVKQGGEMIPGPELMQMHPRDVALVMQTMGAIMGDDKRGERESFWDREEGKPVQRNEFSGPNGGAIEYAEAVAAGNKLLGRTVREPTPALEAGTPGGADAEGEAGTKV